MPLEQKLRKHLAETLESVDEQGTRGPRLIDDARRLWDRIQRFISLDLAAEPDLPAIELACYALQLPMKQAKPPTAGKLGRTNLRERAEQAAELLVSLLSDQVNDDALLDRATRLLQEMPHKTPMLEEAKLLADGLNLEDFGIVGLISQMTTLARSGAGVEQLAEGFEKREEYGYWDARLKDGFHFEPIRQLAKRRLVKARQVATMLAEELKEDRP